MQPEQSAEQVLKVVKEIFTALVTAAGQAEAFSARLASLTKDVQDAAAELQPGRFARMIGIGVWAGQTPSTADPSVKPDALVAFTLPSAATANPPEKRGVVPAMSSPRQAIVKPIETSRSVSAAPAVDHGGPHGFWNLSRGEAALSVFLVCPTLS